MKWLAAVVLAMAIATSAQSEPAHLVFFHGDGTLPLAFGTTVKVDDVKHKVKGNHILRVDVPAGRHVISSDFKGPERTVVAGQTYYFKLVGTSLKAGKQKRVFLIIAEEAAEQMSGQKEQ
jgi:hypothetical protein